MKAGFDGENPYPQRGQFRWESQSVFCRFYAFGAGKTKTCSANKEKTTPNKTEDCSKKKSRNFILIV
jgi:hypothetical protein